MANTKSHQMDRERSTGHREVALCGRPFVFSWNGDSCEACARVARQRAERASRRDLTPEN